MNIQTLIGQLFFISLEAESYRPGNLHVKRSIEEFRPSGIILFPPGCRSRSTMRACLDEVQSLNTNLGLPGPMVVCADHRGGEGTQTIRIAEGLEIPAPMAQCALGDFLPVAAEEMGRVIGEDAISLGINLNLAPYADFLERADIEGFQFGQAIMGSDPETNATLSAGLVRGFHQAGLGATYCVFPGGYGTLPKDPHFFTGTITASLEEIEARYLTALKASMKEGVDAVMLSHWAFPALDAESRPVTFSAPAIRYLRETLGFDGLIMTDAIGMRSAADLAGPEEGADATVRALEAGADLILMGTWTDRNAVEKAFRSGRLSRERLEEAFERVMKLKTRLIPARGDCGEAPKATHVAVMNHWIEKSLTWFKQPAKTLAPTMKVMSLAPWDAFHAEVFKVCPQATTRISPDFSYICGHDTEEACLEGQFKALLGMTQPGETILLGTYNKVDLLAAARLQEAGRKVYVIHAGPPFFAPLAANVEGLLLCYAKSPATLGLAIRSVFGLANPAGVNPVRLKF
ncbi:MAG: glycoside hydrolase family 3 N-terminal domain-containing protein [Saprospiraceae bacterium]